MNEPLVTVFIPCYNHEIYVQQALDSVKNQTYKNIQYFVVDDFSADNSVSVIENWIEKNLKWIEEIDFKFIKHSQNLGICKTLNEIISLAKGKYICGCGSDDILLLDKIEKQVAFMEKQPEDVGILYTNINIIDSNGQIIIESLHKRNKYYKNMPEGWIFDMLVRRNFIPAVSVLARKSCYDVIGLYDENLYYEDWDFLLRASLKYKIVYMDITSANYRILNNSSYHSFSESFLDSSLKLLRKHIKYNQNAKESFRLHLSLYSKQLYGLNSKLAPNWLYLNLKYNITVKNLIFYLACILKIKAQTISILRKYLKK